MFVITFYSTSSTALMLPLPMVAQARDKWCWAACMQAVENYYGNNVATQCLISTYFETHHQNPPWNSNIDCCKTSSPFGPEDYCNQGNDLNGYSNGWPNVPDIMYYLYGTQTTSLMVPISQAQFQTEIFAGRPIVIAWQYSNWGHTVVGFGITGTQVDLMDPTPGTTNHFIGSYQSVVNTTGRYWGDTLPLVNSPKMPTPSVTAFGKNGSIPVNPTTLVNISIGLNPGIFVNYPADWWILAFYNGMTYYFTTGGWTVTPLPFSQKNLSTYNLTQGIFSGTIPAGTSISFYFGVDLSQNGTLNSPFYYDWVTLTSS